MSSSAPILFAAPWLSVWHFDILEFKILFKIESFSYTNSTGSFRRKSMYFCIVGAGDSYTLKVWSLPEYTALGRRGIKEMGIRDQLFVWQQEAETTGLFEKSEVFVPGCWGTLSVQKLFRLMRTHLCGYCFWTGHVNWEAFKKLPSNLNVSQHFSLRWWSCFRAWLSHGQYGAVPSTVRSGVAWHGTVLRSLPRSLGGHGGSSCRSKVFHHFSLNKKFSAFRTRSDPCYFECLPFPRR